MLTNVIILLCFIIFFKTFRVMIHYVDQPKDKKTIRASNFAPALRELVFDIDMTDYDEVRTCCSDKSICKRCWGFMASACDVLDHVLRGTLVLPHANYCCVSLSHRAFSVYNSKYLLVLS
jgi:DNA primase catalytic subunit